MPSSTPASATAPPIDGDTPWRVSLRVFRRHRSAVAGLVIVVAFLLLGLGAPVLAGHDPRAMVSAAQEVPPLSRVADHAYWLGADELGRDLLSRVLFGARISLLIGLVSVSIALGVGVPLGLISGTFGGRTDQVIMRLMDMMLAFPGILLAIAVMAVLGPSLGNVMIAVGAVNVPSYARQVRASVLDLRAQDFVTASTALGAGPVHIMLRVLLPNVLSPVIVLATLGIGSAILEAAGLGFIGLGIEPGTPEWGTMLAESRKNFLRAPWTVLVPGLAITTVVLGFNLFGDGLRDALDPKRKR